MTEPEPPALGVRPPSPRVAAALVAVATGLAWAVAHPAPGVWWLVFAVVPGWLTTVLLLRRDRALVVFAGGVVIGLAAFLPMIRWLANIPGGWAAWPLLASTMGVYVGLASLAVRPWVASRWVAVVGPVIWTGMEIVRARFPLGGFGWGDLASAHTVESWMLTVARVLGADGLTLMTALLGGCAWAAIRTALVVRHEVEPEQGPTVVPIAARTVATMDAVRPLLLATVGVGVLGTLITADPPPTIDEVDVLVVQANDLSSTATGAELDRDIAEAHAAATVAAVAEGGQPQLTVWAENALDRDPTTDEGADLLPAVEQAVAATGSPLVSGVAKRGEDPTSFRNTVTAFDEDAREIGEYVKRKVVPFGEYVPFRSVLGDLPPLRQFVTRDALRGAGPVTLDVAGVRVAPIICFETLFGPVARSAVAHEDAGLLVAVTNDVRFGAGAESAQHVAQSRLRAVETGRAVVHAAIGGTSAILLPDGTIAEVAPLFEVATIRAILPVVSGSTPAMVVATHFSWVVLAAAVVLSLWPVVAGARTRRRGESAAVEQP